ncbi:MAG: amylo-alpha-1,6-glucosidase [Phycisphaerales bacterium]|nr:amylo-alpha-1,6-glucosidase [Phycisphaerales bacterium]
MKPFQNDQITQTWLLANGTGGFSMGTVAGPHTSRYHGYLVAAVDPPVNRVHLLHSVVDAVLDAQGGRQELATHLFGPEFESSPDGWKRLVHTDVSPASVSWTYDLGHDLLIKRTLRLKPFEAVACVQWTLIGQGEVRLELRPLLSFRDFHSLRQPHDEPITCSIDGVHMTASTMDLNLCLELSRGVWQQDRQTWKNFAYAVDRQRGQDWQEQLEGPACATIELSPGHPTVTLTASTNSAPSVKPLSVNMESEQGRLDTTVARLEESGRAYVVRRFVPGQEKQGVSIIAGYPWFADWGRDTMISLPGLLLGAGTTESAHQVLDTFGESLLEGLIPNRFDDRSASAHYNTADASLWYLQAIGHVAHAEDETRRAHVMARHLERARELLHWYRRGTHFGIHVDASGLVNAGAEGKALTWMDAICDGIPATPRRGKPVELSALWYSGLLIVAELTQDPIEAAALKNEAAVTAASFVSAFWDKQRDCLFDVLAVDGEDVIPDKSVRPNQIFACSLPHSMLTLTQQRQILDQIEASLLTPMGLRTLAPDSPGYQPRYQGSMMERDQAYHNGTVWPWLMGPYVLARLASAQDPAKMATQMRNHLEPLVASLDDDCLGHVAEIYDGEAPHEPHGCRAQAWSLAELMRAMRLLNELTNNHGGA